MVGAIDPISAMLAMAAVKPVNAPIYIHTAPPVPPFTKMKVLIENCASHVAMRTIVKPNIDKNRKFRYVHFRQPGRSPA